MDIKQEKGVKSCFKYYTTESPGLANVQLKIIAITTKAN
jgi:hypothetical protein